MSAPSSTPRRRLAAAYFGVQAAAVTAWWLVQVIWPEIRGWFWVADWLAWFGLPDGLVVVAGSAAVALGAPARRRWVPPAAWLVTGGLLYATLCCAMLPEAVTSLSVGLMTAATVGSAWASRVISSAA